jgi:hypothetical protein
MLAHPTLEQLRALGLHGMAKGFKENSNIIPKLVASITRNGSS